MSSTPKPTATTNRRAVWMIAAAVAGMGVLLLCGVFAVAAALLVARPAPETRPAAIPAPPVPGSESFEPAGEAAPFPDRIAFVDPAGRLGTISPDGSESRLLTPPGKRFQFPAWSPDGRHVAAIGSDGLGSGVYVTPDQESTDSLQELYRNGRQAPIYLYWSPDSRYVSFLVNDPAGIALYLAPADASQSSRALATGQPFYWDWNASSDQMFIHTGGLDEDARLAFIDTEGQIVDDDVATPGLFQAPGISSSGDYLAFSAAEGESFQVVVQDIEDGRRLEVSQVGPAALGWSPLADQLAFISPRSRSMGFFGPLRMAEADSGEVRVLAPDLVFAFFWSPDGRSIAYLTLDTRSRDPGAGLGVPISSAPPDLQPVSRQLQQDDGVRLRLWVVDVEGGQRRLLSTFRPSALFVNQFLPFFDQYALSHRVWSPNSDAIVMPMVDSTGQERIHVISVADGASRPIVAGSMAFWSQQ